MKKISEMSLVEIKDLETKEIDALVYNNKNWWMYCQKGGIGPLYLLSLIVIFTFIVLELVYHIGINKSHFVEWYTATISLFTREKSADIIILILIMSLFQLLPLFGIVIFLRRLWQYHKESSKKIFWKNLSTLMHKANEIRENVRKNIETEKERIETILSPIITELGQKLAEHNIGKDEFFDMAKKKL